MNYGSKVATAVAYGLMRAGKWLQSLAGPKVDGNVTGTKRWMPNAEDIALEEYVQEAVKFCRGEKCNLHALREIETVALGKKTGAISEADAPNYRWQVVAALEMARSMPLSTRGGVGASQIVPDLVMRIDHLLNGDPLWRGCNRNPPPCFVAPTTLDKYVLEAAKYVCGLPSDETFMRGVEEIAPNPVGEQYADEYRRRVLAHLMSEQVLKTGTDSCTDALRERVSAYEDAKHAQEV